METTSKNKPISRVLILLAMILAAGALIRILYLLEMVHHPDFAVPAVDAAYHDYWARGLATGNWAPPKTFPDPRIPVTPYFRPPGYPYFLAGIHLLTGGSPLAVRITQMALGLLSCLLAFLLARKPFGDTAGLLFTALMALCWVFIYYEGELLEPPLLVFMSLLLLILAASWARKPTLPMTLAAGAALGLFGLVRPNVMLFALPLFLWGGWVLLRRDVRRHSLIHAAVFLFGTVVAIAPAAMRNWLVSGDPVLISSNAGINLYIGNHPQADGLVKGYLPGLGMFMTSFDYQSIAKAVELRAGRPLKASEVSGYFAGLAWDYIRSHPLATLSLTARKALLFWGPREVSHNKEDELERENSRVLRFVPVTFPLALGLALAGGVLLLLGRGWSPSRETGPAREEPRREILILALLFVLSYSASYLPFFVAGRYRVPIIPALLFFGACGLDSILGSLVNLDLRRAGTGLATVVLFCGLASVNFTGYEPDRARWHYDRGNAYGGSGDAESALSEFLKAVGIDARYPEAYNSLGAIYLDRGETEKARAAFEAGIRADPSYPFNHINMGRLYFSRGRYLEAVSQYRLSFPAGATMWRVRLDLGLSYLALGKRNSAERELRAALLLNPGNPEIQKQVKSLSGSYPDAVR